MSAEHFERLHLERARLSPPLASWIDRGYSQWLAGIPLDVAFDLRPAPGQRTAATKARLKMRNAYLHQAWLLVAGGSDWARAQNLAAAIARLPTAYRRYQLGHISTSRLTHLLCLAQGYGRLPSKPRQLLNICAGVQ
ncbi:MAG: hypothetical protein IPK63_09525 [Candidatus Competibacteraceae bacterium]|nr:hypothetical protein [Candidatus Competibacteraceae bacterium]